MRTDGWLFQSLLILALAATVAAVVAHQLTTP